VSKTSGFLHLIENKLLHFDRKVGSVVTAEEYTTYELGVSNVLQEVDERE
jgi:hypothetical protein